MRFLYLNSSFSPNDGTATHSIPTTKAFLRFVISSDAVTLLALSSGKGAPEAIASEYIPSDKDIERQI
jgi:hypothetical protein